MTKTEQRHNGGQAETETDRQIHRYKHADTQTEAGRYKDTGTEREPRTHGDTKMQIGSQTQTQRNKDRQTNRDISMFMRGKYLCYSLIFFGLNKTDRIGLLDNHIPIMLVLFLA